MILERTPFGRTHVSGTIVCVSEAAQILSFANKHLCIIIIIFCAQLNEIGYLFMYIYIYAAL